MGQSDSSQKGVNPIWRPSNPHDRFCRQTAYNEAYVSDFLKNYAGEPLVSKVDLDNLREAKTTYLSDELKEVLMDESFAAHLIDDKWNLEVLLHLEHKSTASTDVMIQLLAEAAMALHYRRFKTFKDKTPFKPPLQLMIMVYNGTDDWDGEKWFQDIYQNVPEELRPFLIQFKVIFINLRAFQYGKLPGKPVTQAIVECLKRATDGTFTDNLSGIFRLVSIGDLVEEQKVSLVRSIATYCKWSENPTFKPIFKALSTAFREPEGVNMIETIKDEWELAAYEKGCTDTEISAKVSCILLILQERFGRVSQCINNSLNSRTDVTAVDSLVVQAAVCTSIEDFESLL
ncbi:MAG: Rpn family recombination-promoting nuclease/putative transposase [Planctomycetaceae bacterium]|jgi:hypothetical protein|nr:Rpn family recombination-promoting nuclease/putative transposase [Planctomycetaceae bacterium]